MTINDFYKLLYMKYNSQKYNIIYDPCYFNESKLYIPNTIFNEKSRFNVVPLCIFKKHRSYFHYNILILDNYEKTIERFEPIDMTKSSQIDELLQVFVENNGYTYYFQKYRGPQWMEIMEIGKSMSCGWWILMYIEKRFMYSEFYIQEKVISSWMQELCYYGFHKRVNEYKNKLENELYRYKNCKFVKDYVNSNYTII